MKYRYVPILRWKRGEHEALKHLSQAARTDVVPLFLIEPERYVGKKQKKKVPAVSAPDAFAHVVENCWGTGPFYADASRISDPNAIVDLANASRKRGLKLIPATRLGAALPYQAAVASVHKTDKRGAALRVDLAGFTSIPTWLVHWGLAPQETDLIADFGDSVATIHSFGSIVAAAFSALHVAKSWRSVTCAGTSMPENFSGYAQGLHQLDRAEYVLWQQLVAAGVGYHLNYGDYATVSTSPAPAGIAWGFPINVRYTFADKFLICRGVGTTGFLGVDMDKQLVSHAKSIAAFPQRGALPSCWADGRIDSIAAGNVSPGNLESWVQIGVNRHVELVRGQLP
jgi:hypothetical protein